VSIKFLSLKNDSKFVKLTITSHALPDCVEILYTGTPRSVNCENYLSVKSKMADGPQFLTFKSL